MAIIIRFIVESDYHQWNIVLRKFIEDMSLASGIDFSISEEESMGTFARLLDPKESIYGVVAEDDETHTIIGLISFAVYRHTRAITHYVFITEVFVDETYRKQGIGRKLMERVFQFADDNNYANVHWMTTPENRLAYLLYKGTGEQTGLVGYSRNLPTQEAKP